MSGLAITAPPWGRHRVDLVGHVLSGEEVAAVLTVTGHPRWMRAKRPPTPAFEAGTAFLPLAVIRVPRRWRRRSRWSMTIQMDDVSDRRP